MEKEKILPKVSFKETDFIQTRSQSEYISLNFDIPIKIQSLSLIIDVYNIYNHSHPEGHLGWWKFPINKPINEVKIKIKITKKSFFVECDHFSVTDFWINKYMNNKGFLINAFIKSDLTNEVFDLDRLPFFTKKSDLIEFRSKTTTNFDKPYKLFTRNFSKRKIILICHDLFIRDAVGNFCLDLYYLLKKNGMTVEIYAKNFDLSLNNLVKRIEVISKDKFNPRDKLVYFFSTYDSFLEEIIGLSIKKKILYFHGITNPNILQVFDTELSKVCNKGIDQMRLLTHFDTILTNSKYNAKFLFDRVKSKKNSLKDIKIIPPIIDYSSQILNKNKSNNQTIFLSVGRIVSNKKIEDILSFFHEYLKIDRSAVLYLVGTPSSKAYLDFLKWKQSKLNLSSRHIIWSGSISKIELLNLYKKASLLISMSEDEGFCLPIYEAMKFSLPVCMYATPAIKEVYEGAGILFSTKNFLNLVNKISLILKDKNLKENIINKQLIIANKLLKKMGGDALVKLICL